MRRCMSLDSFLSWGMQAKPRHACAVNMGDWFIELL